jgi:hypothetical protein
VRASRALVAVIVVFICACTTSDPLPGYQVASAGERASILGTIEEYYDIWSRAMVTADISPLYVRHPKLAQGAVPQRGINNEGFTVTLPSIRDHLVREAHVDIESYEPLRAFVRDDRAVAYSRGVFTWTYGNGSETKGELRVRFDMTRIGGIWSIDQTDEWVLGEGTPPPTPR